MEEKTQENTTNAPTENKPAVSSDVAVKETPKTEAPKTDTPKTDVKPERKPFKKTGGYGGGNNRPRNTRGRRPRSMEKPEFEQKIIDIRRVTRVVSGGRRFSFAVAVVAGDKKGRVGVGTGKSSDTSLAIEKAFRSAKKNMVKLKLTKEMSIPHQVEAKENSARLVIMPAPGRGIVAGSAVRTVLDLAGAKDVGAKIFSRSKNKLSIARAAVEALSKLNA